MAPPKKISRSGKLEPLSLDNPAPAIISPSGKLKSVPLRDRAVYSGDEDANQQLIKDARASQNKPITRNVDLHKMGGDLGSALTPLVKPIVKAGAMLNPDPWLKKETWQDIWQGTKDFGKGLSNDAHFLATGDYTTKPFQQHGSGVGDMVLGMQELKPFQFSSDHTKPFVSSPLLETGKQVYNTPGSAYPFIAGALTGNPRVTQAGLKAAKQIPGLPRKFDRYLYDKFRPRPGVPEVLNTARQHNMIQIPGSNITGKQAHQQAHLYRKGKGLETPQEAIDRALMPNIGAMESKPYEKISYGGFASRGQHQPHKTVSTEGTGKPKFEHDRPAPIGAPTEKAPDYHAPTIVFPGFKQKPGHAKGAPLGDPEKRAQWFDWYKTLTDEQRGIWRHEMLHALDRGKPFAKAYTPENWPTTLKQEVLADIAQKKGLISGALAAVEKVGRRGNLYPRTKVGDAALTTAGVSAEVIRALGDLVKNPAAYARVMGDDVKKAAAWARKKWDRIQIERRIRRDLRALREREKMWEQRLTPAPIERDPPPPPGPDMDILPSPKPRGKNDPPWLENLIKRTQEKHKRGSLDDKAAKKYIEDNPQLLKTPSVPKKPDPRP